MSPSRVAWTSPGPVAADLATSPTCPMVIVSDVDGTLRDPLSGSLKPADLALATLCACGVPVIFAGQYAARELIALQTEIGVAHPFICAAANEVHIPAGYFAEPRVLQPPTSEWDVIQLGRDEPLSRAIGLLGALYRSRNPQVMLIGLGDDWSDRFLLMEVDVPIIVRNDAVDQADLIALMPDAFVTRQSCPAGWAEAVIGWPWPSER